MENEEKLGMITMISLMTMMIMKMKIMMMAKVIEREGIDNIDDDDIILKNYCEHDNDSGDRGGG